MYKDNIELLKSFKFNDNNSEKCYVEMIENIEKYISGDIDEAEFMGLVVFNNDPDPIGGEDFILCFLYMLHKNKDKVETVEALTQIMIDNYYKCAQ